MNYVLYGSDASRVAHKIDQIKKKHNISETAITMDALNTEQSHLFMEMDSFSIFDEKKMIILENATFLSGRDTTKYATEELLKRLDTDQRLIMVYCCPSDHLDKRKKLVKAFEKASTVYACKALDQKSQPGYIQELLKASHVRMDRDAFTWFSRHVGMDTLKIGNEVEKLSLYNSVIHLRDVKALTSVEPTDDVFKMVDALFNKNGLLLLSYYRNFRAQNMEPVAIVGLLAGQIRFLFQVRVCMDQGMWKDQIASELHAHPYRVQINMQRAQDHTPEQLLDQLSELAQFDRDMKRGLVDKDEGFEQFILKMLT